MKSQASVHTTTPNYVHTTIRRLLQAKNPCSSFIQADCLVKEGSIVNRSASDSEEDLIFSDGEGASAEARARESTTDNASGNLTGFTDIASGSCSTGA